MEGCGVVGGVNFRIGPGQIPQWGVCQNHGISHPLCAIFPKHVLAMAIEDDFPANLPSKKRGSNWVIHVGRRWYESTLEVISAVRHPGFGICFAFVETDSTSSAELRLNTNDISR